jgi:prephenate dehydrogenase
MTQHTTLLGLGLMGGSLGLALKKRPEPGVVSAYARRAETRRQALEMGVCDRVFDTPQAAVAEADITVLCVPVCVMPALVAQCQDAFKTNSVVTDVGSTKAWLEQQLLPMLSPRGVHFVGSHPVAGSEQQGIAVSDPELYRDAVVVVSGSESVPLQALERVTAYWRSTGAVVRAMPAERHDRILACTSHLPHMAAAALAMAVGRDEMPAGLVELCGTGFRDTTRLAEGSPAVWRDIVCTNRRFIAEELNAMEQQLAALRQTVESGTDEALVSFLTEARERRKHIMQGRKI